MPRRIRYVPKGRIDRLRRTNLIVLPLVGVALAASLLLSGTPSVAQDTPEDLLDEPEPTEEDDLGWTGSADLGANLTRGNSEVTNVTTGLEVAYLRDRDRWRARGSVLRTTTDGEETANRIRSVLQYDLFPTDHGYIFARGTGMSNRPAGIRNRFVVGTGGGYDVVRRDRLGVSLEAGATHLTEEFVDRTTDDHFNVLAAQNLEFEVGEDTRLTQNLEVQPRVDDLSDVVAEAQAALSTTLVGDLGLRVSITADYESEPFDPADEEPRESLDTTFVTGITYTF